MSVVPKLAVSLLIIISVYKVTIVRNRMAVSRNSILSLCMFGFCYYFIIYCTEGKNYTCRLHNYRNSEYFLRVEPWVMTIIYSIYWLSSNYMRNDGINK